MLYTVPQASCYVRILKIRYKSNNYLKADIEWISKPGLTPLYRKKNVKILNESLKFWETENSEKPVDSVSVAELEDRLGIVKDVID